MTIVSTTRATLDDLYREEGKTELIGGRIVRFMASGRLPATVAEDIFVSLRTYAKSSGNGEAHADGLGYAVAELPSGRESFSPDASYYVGPAPMNQMRFIDGPCLEDEAAIYPTFACITDELFIQRIYCIRWP